MIFDSRSNNNDPIAITVSVFSFYLGPSVIQIQLVTMEQHRLTASQYLLHQQASAAAAAQGTAPAPAPATNSVVSPPAEPRDPRMRVVMVGINYLGTSNQLNGCVNDTVHLSQILKTAGACPQIKLLVDAGYNGQPAPAEASRPTKANILAALQWLVSDAQPGDRLFFHYSGHGIQIPGTDAGEEDGMDEALVPCDFMQLGGINARGCISDDVIRSYFNRLPAGVTLHAWFDCCHSATMADLRFAYPDLCRASKRVQVNTKRTETAAQVIAISGCQDYQVSISTISTITAVANFCQKFCRRPPMPSWSRPPSAPYERKARSQIASSRPSTTTRRV
ncbi:metacaspase [Medusavirus stheno T3]|uniref:Metacaspase n=1 Tax=Medusavirus stheno T3 TaxID=3069717 RepID=A0A7S8BDT8_9VIRU|nr:metacaspase [Acanthamoeba castellanii medusavirus]QPB44569.1 metacaspase [Medusavirus stheno T3]